MKGVVESFFTKIGMTKKAAYDGKGWRTFLHPGRQATISYEGKELGYLGEVHPAVCDNYGIGTRAYIAVLDIQNVLEFATYDRKYQGIAKYPAVTRDISMVVPKQVLAGDIEQIIEQRGGKILEECHLFDIYEGEQIEKGFKSVAYSISFRAKDRTLEEADVSVAMKKILNGLEGLGAVLRG
jgi:Phenylalanyl-tRNA synthetase beta subunit